MSLIGELVAMTASRRLHGHVVGGSDGDGTVFLFHRGHRGIGEQRPAAPNERIGDAAQVTQRMERRKIGVAQAFAPFPIL